MFSFFAEIKAFLKLSKNRILFFYDLKTMNQIFNFHCQGKTVADRWDFELKKYSKKFKFISMKNTVKRIWFTYLRGSQPFAFLA
jgi:hypothetical protein